MPASRVVGSRIDVDSESNGWLNRVFLNHAVLMREWRLPSIAPRALPEKPKNGLFASRAKTPQVWWGWGLVLVACAWGPCETRHDRSLGVRAGLRQPLVAPRPIRSAFRIANIGPARARGGPTLGLRNPDKRRGSNRLAATLGHARFPRAKSSPHPPLPLPRRNLPAFSRLSQGVLIGQTVSCETHPSSANAFHPTTAAAIATVNR